ncbi:hypothetical protein PGTUg99_002271 [Puccinia graminis f. sp. tritici]|uniref:Uncharacterized protein n=1 Tax=Puccinia graminis f. sp. tritici TaxID=56615 RepID=A0A5B0S8J6_PUCGR|nr:hypothetical protein PGTUg99_002271 [Puccinia graminis f. sp. tritici]
MYCDGGRGCPSPAVLCTQILSDHRTSCARPSATLRPSPVQPEPRVTGRVRQGDQNGPSDIHPRVAIAVRSLHQPDYRSADISARYTVRRAVLSVGIAIL